jgi:hypothetical protein
MKPTKRPPPPQLLAARSRRLRQQLGDAADFARWIEIKTSTTGISVPHAIALHYSIYAQREWFEGRPGAQRDAARAALIKAAEQRLRRHRKRVSHNCSCVPTRRAGTPASVDTGRRRRST